MNGLLQFMDKMQKSRQMDDKLLTGWAILPLPRKKLLVKHVYLSH
jgi:hypothetical protein